MCKIRTRFSRSFFMLLFFLIAVFFDTTFAAPFNDWKYREGDSPRTMFGGFAWLEQKDDSDWLQFDGESAPPVSGSRPHVWLKTRLDPSAPEFNTLFFITANESFRLWHDDKLIYQYGTLAQQSMGYGWRWHLVVLPPSRDRMHTLTFQMYSDTPDNLGRIMNLSINRTENQIQQIFKFDLPYLINLPVAVLLILIVGLYYLNQRELQRLYLGILAFLFIFLTWMFSASNVTVLLWDKPSFWWHLRLAMLYFMPAAGSFIVFEISASGFRSIVKKMTEVYMVLIAVALAMEFGGKNGFLTVMPAFFVAMTVIESAQIYFIHRSAKDGFSYCRAFLVPLSGLSFIGIVIGLCRYLGYTGLNPIFNFIAPFSILTFAYFILSILGDQFRNERRLIALASALEIEVASAVERSEIDPLTKCFNRQKFNGSVKESVTLARTANLPLSIMMLDIDFFKKVNDTYGHDEGDKVLINFADVIRRRISSHETLFRWGGEEFIILCMNSDLQKAKEIGEILRRAVETSTICEKRRITCSVGIAIWHDDDEEDEAVFKRMDDSLYAAKQGGRNRVVTEEELTPAQT